jgi:hypothetical protein
MTTFFIKPEDKKTSDHYFKIWKKTIQTRPLPTARNSNGKVGNWELAEDAATFLNWQVWDSEKYGICVSPYPNV